MGALIEGDPRRKDGRLYTMGEISRATGIKTATLQARRKRMGIPPTGAYPYNVVRQLIRPVMRKEPREGNVDRLKKQLKEDGML